VAEGEFFLVSKLAIAVVTCTIYHDKRFLVIRRRDEAKKFGGKWGFPGGKVEQGETAIGTLVREVTEETGLMLKDELFFVDSYFYGNSVGLHFSAFSTTDNVTTEPGVDYKWLDSFDDLQKLPRIPGIDFHILQTQELMKQNGAYLSQQKLDYTPSKYIN
jgi:mutator protein MutT